MRVKTMKARIEQLTEAAKGEKDKGKKTALVTAAGAYERAITALGEAGKALKDGGVTLFDTAKADEDK